MHPLIHPLHLAHYSCSFTTPKEFKLLDYPKHSQAYISHAISIYDMQTILRIVVWWISPHFTHVCVSYPLWRGRKTRKQKENKLSAVWDNFQVNCILFICHVSCGNFWEIPPVDSKEDNNQRSFTWMKHTTLLAEAARVTYHQEIHMTMTTNSQGE